MHDGGVVVGNSIGDGTVVSQLGELNLKTCEMNYDGTHEYQRQRK